MKGIKGIDLCCCECVKSDLSPFDKLRAGKERKAAKIRQHHILSLTCTVEDLLSAIKGSFNPGKGDLNAVISKKSLSLGERSGE